MKEFFECPHCGGRIQEGRKFCPLCGSDGSTGWRSEEEIESESLELPDTSLDDESYEEFLKGERLSPVHSKGKEISLIIIGVIGILILTILVLAFLIESN